MPSDSQLFLDRLKAGNIAAREDESLRWNQSDITESLAKFLEAPEGTPFSQFGDDVPEKERSRQTVRQKAAMIESSPGTGKTRVMGYLAKKAADLDNPLRDSSKAVKVLLLTPRLGLNRQMLEEFEEKLGIDPRHVAIYDGAQSTAKKSGAKDAPVLIGTYQSLEAMLENGIISLDPSSPQYRGLVMMDEAHELVDFSFRPKGAPAATPPLTINSFINDHQTTLLFTGTDDGVSEKRFNGNVPKLYSKRLLKAYEQGLTCEIQPGLVNIRANARKPDADWDAHIDAAGKDKEHSAELLRYFSRHPRVIETAVETQLKGAEPDLGPLHQHKALFFVDSVEAGRLGTEYFNKRAHELHLDKGPRPCKAAHLHSGLSVSERKRIVKAYKKGEITALFNDRMVTFGFDDEETPIIHNTKMYDRDDIRDLARMEQVFTRATRNCSEFEQKYGMPKKALLLTYRPLDHNGRPPSNLLIAADLMAGHTPKPKKPGKGGGDFGGGGGTVSLSDEFDVTVDFDFGHQMEEAEIMRQAHEAAKRAAEEAASVPKTQDGREYVIGPNSNTGGHREYGFFTALYAALPDAGYQLSGGTTLPKEQVRRLFQKAHYYHPDVSSDWKTRFAQEKYTEIPSTQDGRQYVQGPTGTIEEMKYKYFSAQYDAIPDTGYSLPDGTILPKEEVRKLFNNAYYYHPDAHTAFNDNFSKDKLTEISVTADNREYVQGPNGRNDRRKSDFFTSQYDAIPDTGYSLADGAVIPKEEVRKFFKRAYYYHPDVYADWNKSFAEMPIGIPTTLDGREYIPGPAGTIDQRQYKFFGSKYKTVLDTGYPLSDDIIIPKEKVRIAFGNTNYYHPDVHAAWSEEFATEKLTDIPKAKNGQEYVLTPHRIRESSKCSFFKSQYDAVPDTGYPLADGTTLPKEEVRKFYKRAFYYHPEAHAAWTKSFEQEICSEIPTTIDGRQYIQGPSSIKNQTQFKFFKAQYDAVPDTGYPLAEGAILPKEGVRKVFNTAYYYHPDVHPVWSERFVKEKKTEIPSTPTTHAICVAHPTTLDSIEYMEGPNRNRGEWMKSDFFKSQLSAVPETGYPLPDGTILPKEEIIKIFNEAKYYHPVVYADWNKRFAQEKHTEIPTTQDGMAYVRGPGAKSEVMKYTFFGSQFNKVPETGYPLPDSSTLPKDEIIKVFKNTNYYHPIVHADWDKRFTQERLTELPTTTDGRQYIQGPHALKESRKFHFLDWRAKKIPDTGFPLSVDTVLPKEQVRKKFNSAFYYHPDAYAVLMAAYAEKFGADAAPSATVQPDAAMNRLGTANGEALSTSVEEVLEEKKQASAARTRRKHP